MFGKRTRRRRSSSHPLVFSARFRRLRVEPMEGRLLLSATSYQIDYPNLQVGEFPADNTRLVFAPGYFALPTPGIEGGFINLGADVVTYNYSDSDNSTSFQSDANQTRPADLYGLYTNGLDAADGTVTKQSNDGLQALRYFSVGSNLVLESQPTAAVVKLTENQLGSSEGGAISIPTLVASLQHEEHLATNDESSLPTAIEATGELHRSVRSAASAKSLISGEWARAAMFETVSSERGANQLPDANDGQANSTAEESSAANPAPVSAKVTSDESKILGQQDGSADKNNQAMPAGRRRHQTSDSVVRPAVYRIEATDWNWIGNVHQVGSLAAPTATGRQAINDLATGADDANAAMLATDTMFDELGRPATNMIESVPGDESNLATRSAVPLLMILALERIATFNSRQSARTSPTAPPRARRQQS